MMKSEMKVVYVAHPDSLLGRVMVERLLQDTENVAKVYHCIDSWDFIEGLLEKIPYQRSVCVSPGADVPKDVTHLILFVDDCAIHEPIGQKLARTVSPILKMLDQCKRQKAVRGITVLSTAYLQPPPPFRAPRDGTFPFLLDPFCPVSAFDVFQYATVAFKKGQRNDQLGLFATHVPDFYQLNTFALAHHIMEHVINDKYASLPIVFVRPSIIHSKWCLGGGRPDENEDEGKNKKRNSRFWASSPLRRSPIVPSMPKAELDSCLNNVASMCITGITKAEKLGKQRDSSGWHRVILARPQVSDLTPATLKAVRAAFNKSFRSGPQLDLLLKAKESSGPLEIEGFSSSDGSSDGSSDDSPAARSPDTKFLDQIISDDASLVVLAYLDDITLKHQEDDLSTIPTINPGYEINSKEPELFEI